MKTLEKIDKKTDYPMYKSEELIAEIRVKILRNRIANALKLQRTYIQITTGKLL